jgi:hypothetical protein
MTVRAAELLSGGEVVAGVAGLDQPHGCRSQFSVLGFRGWVSRSRRLVRHRSWPCGPPPWEFSSPNVPISFRRPSALTHHPGDLPAR